MVKGPISHQKYLPSVRKFCLRMLFHSRAAYNELRHFFGKNLPAQRTIQRWLRSVDGSPGITKMSLDALAGKVQDYKDSNKELHVSVAFDDMSTRNHLSWNEVKKSFDGFSTVTNQNVNEERKPDVANSALVYMVVGPDFRIAVAYFMLNGLQAIDRAALSKEVIRCVEATGAIVVSFTGDGLRANITTFEKLGCDFAADKPFFPSPSHPGLNIAAILDPGHMIKLTRKDFAERKLYYKNDLLKWDLLEKLAKKQDADNFELGNKLTQRRHIMWKLSPMTVSYAVETISNSVADVLEQLCEDKCDDYVGCESTVQFIRLMNNLFDVLNYGDGKKTNNHFKQPMCESTMPAFLELFDQFREFVNEMSVEIRGIKRPIKTYFRGKNKFMGFFGFLQNITSLIGIYTDYVQNGTLDVFYAFQFSQDHLETYFSLIRSSLGGANVNPTAQQFMAAYRKLLLVIPHMSSKHTNCNYFHVSDILTVSSAQTPTVPSKDVNDMMNTKAIEINIDYETLISTPLSPYDRHMCAYLSSIVEANILKKIKAQPIATCQDCLSVFSENHKIVDTFIEKKNISGHFITQPCSSSYQIIVTCNSICEELKANGHVEFNVMSKTIMSCLNFEELYELSQFSCHRHTMKITQLTHKEHFIFNIVSEYLRMKSVKIGKRITDEEWMESMSRRKARRLRILNGH